MFHARLGRHGPGRWLRRLHPVARGAPSHRVSAGERPALRRPARGRLSRLRRRGQGCAARGPPGQGRRRDGPLLRHGDAAPAHRQALQGLSPAGGPRPGAPGRSRSADSRRADHRPRPAADRRDPRPHQVAGRSAHGHPVDAHPARSLHGLRQRHHHQSRAHRGPGNPGRAGAAGLSRRAARGAGGRPHRGRGGRPQGAARSHRGRDPGHPRRRAALPARIAARARRPCRAGWPGDGTGLGAAGAASDRSLSRGSLHPGGGGRGPCAPDRGSRGGGGAVMGWLPVFKKEMRLYFGSPVAYAVATFFLFVTAFFFVPAFRGFADLSMRAAMQPQFGGNLNATESILRPLIYNMAVVLLFFIPMVTMRLIAEERRAGNMELLLTYPLRGGENLLGKFLAALVLYLLILVLTLFYPATVAWFTRLEWGAGATGYLGLLLIRAALLSLR